MRCNNIKYTVFPIIVMCFLCAISDSVQAETASSENPAEDQFMYELNRQGIDFLKEKEYMKAVQIFEHAFEITPNDEAIVNNLAVSYNSYGLACIDNKEYLEGIHYLSKALDIKKNDETLKNNIAVAYYKFADECRQEGKTDHCIEAMEQCMKYDPSNETYKKHFAVLLYNEGVEYFNNREFDKAEQFLQRSMSLNDNYFLTHQVLGEIAYLRQDLATAEEYWRTAWEIGTGKEREKTQLRDKIRKLKTEKKLEKKYDNYPSENFIIRYEKESNSESGYEIRSILRSAYRLIGRDFSYFPKEKIPVIIYPPSHFSQSVGQGHEGIRAIYDGKIRVPAIDADTDKSTFKSFIFHEYTHAIIYELAGSQCPLWLNEGLAQYQENKIKPIDMRYFASEFSASRTLSLRDVLNIKSIDVVSDVSLFYAQAFSMTDYLLRKYQFYKIKQMLEAMKAGTSQENVFNKYLHLTPEKFERNWVRDVTNKYV